MTEPDASLVVPLYKARDLVPGLVSSLIAFSKISAYRWELIFVCDGRFDDTEAELRRLLPPGFGRVIAYDENRGKGFAVRTGVAASHGRAVAFTDADLAYPLDQLDGFIADILEDRCDLAIANRVHPQSRFLMSYRIFPYILVRHYCSRLYNGVARTALGLPYLDLQAGLKAFNRRVGEGLVSKVRADRFGFDLELLTLAHLANVRVRERPAFFRWEDVVTTVAMARTGGELFRTMWRVYWTSRGSGWKLDEPSGASRSVPTTSESPPLSREESSVP